MPNRIIKESICTSGDIDALSSEAEIMFYRLIVNCDDFGRLDARPAILRAKCFPLRIDKVKDKDVERWLGELVTQGLLFIYEAKGNRYMQLRTWTKHQQVRATRSKYPGPDDEGAHLISDAINCNQMQSDVPVIQSNPIQSESYSIHESGFGEFWSVYPKKIGKKAAESAWKKVKPSAELITRIMEAVERAKQSAQWQKEDGRFIPNPATWLNQGRWDDELEPSPKDDAYSTLWR